jgi:hypothetical protein
MIRCVIMELFARLEFFPSKKTLTLRLPLFEYKSVAVKSWKMQDGYLLVEMAAETATPLR